MAIIKRTRADGTSAYRVVVHSPQQGHVTIGTFRRKKDAELAEAEYKRQSKLDGVVFIPKRITLAELSDEWIATRRVKPQTLESYKSRSAHMVESLGDRLINGITKPDCELFLTSLHAGPLGASTANAVFRQFRCIMRYALESAYIRTMPTAGIRLPRESRREGMLIIAPQAHLRLVQATCEHYRVLVHTWVFTGLRAGEVMGLRWTDIDLKKGEIHVHNQRLKKGGYGELKTKASRRTVYISKSTAKVLAEWKLRCPQTVERFVFPSESGDGLSYSHLYNSLILKLREVEGFDTIKPHDFRHTFVSYLIAQGADIKYIQHQCGHESVTLTLDTYGHLLRDDKVGYADRLADWYVAATLPPAEKEQVSSTAG